MKLKSVKLGFAIWFLAIIQLATLIPVIEAMSSIGTSAIVTSIIFPIIGFVMMFVLGIAVMRGVNDKMTLVVVAIFAIVNLSIAMGILVILLLIRRFSKNKTFTKNIWFLPGIIQTVFAVINLINYGVFTFTLKYLIIYLSSYLATVALYFILGYWLLKMMKYETSAEATIAYYDDLLARGVISAEEYESKTSALKNVNGNGVK